MRAQNASTIAAFDSMDFLFRGRDEAWRPVAPVGNRISAGLQTSSSEDIIARSTEQSARDRLALLDAK